ncbi:hypothetical protein LCGC14_1494950 [marine sediment metagenome]|uniref:Uncharacterized protein n=1 Tax=marine sediment metagenome TaxID=412755 RepID=A0A0F9JRK7_9ZZZZ
MDRRGFTKLIAAAVLGVRVADKLLPAARSWSMSHYVNPAGAVPWPPSPITDELLADAGGFLVPQDFAEQIEADLLLYGNAYTRSNASRVHPLIAIGRRHA